MFISSEPLDMISAERDELAWIKFCINHELNEWFAYFMKKVKKLNAFEAIGPDLIGAFLLSAGLSGTAGPTRCPDELTVLRYFKTKNKVSHNFDTSVHFKEN